mmetsp:Transcript_8820/g.18925  ORF Transcript_8820/g.18925 Transcript_8820/m.18925 type:complete len:167 (+) Transcript_8820:22-522(+)
MRLSTKLLVVAATAALFSSQAPLGPLALADDTAISASADAQAEVKVDDEGCAHETCANPEATDEAEDPSCPSRPHVVRCAAKYLDKNQNGALERSELDSIMNEVPWLLRSLLRVIGSVDAIMKKCDADGDGKITIDGDMEQTKETCLASCFKRNAFKRLFFPECTE